MTLEQTSPEGGLCLADVVMYSCAVEDSHQLVWRYTANGNIQSRSFVFDDPVNGQVFNLGLFELVLTDTEPITTTTGIIMPTATSANGLTLAEKDQ